MGNNFHYKKENQKLKEFAAEGNRKKVLELGLNLFDRYMGRKWYESACELATEYNLPKEKKKKASKELFYQQLNKDPDYALKITEKFGLDEQKKEAITKIYDNSFRGHYGRGKAERILKKLSKEERQQIYEELFEKYKNGNWIETAEEIGLKGGLEEKVIEMYEEKNHKLSDAIRVAANSGMTEKAIELFLKNINRMNQEDFYQIAQMAKDNKMPQTIEELSSSLIEKYKASNENSKIAEILEWEGKAEKAFDFHFKSKNYKRCGELLEWKGELEGAMKFYAKTEKYREVKRIVSDNPELTNKGIEILENSCRYEAAGGMAARARMHDKARELFEKAMDNYRDMGLSKKHRVRLHKRINALITSRKKTNKPRRLKFIGRRPKE